MLCYTSTYSFFDMMKNYFLPLVLGFMAFSAFAQESPVPEKYVLEEASDYEKYEDDIVECTAWLLNTAPDEQTEDQQRTGKFIVTWLGGSPDVEVEVNANVVTFINENPQMLLLFMAGWASYAIENESTRVSGNKAGIEAVVTYYKKYKDQLNKDPHIEDYSKKIKKGELESWLEETI